MNVSWFDRIATYSSPPNLMPIEVILGKIATGSDGVKELVEQVRLAKTTEDKIKLKTSLPAVFFSGEFTNAVEVVKRDDTRYKSYGTDKSLKKHSGLCVIDLDDLDDVDHTKFEMMNVPFVYAAFISPSGKGLKLLFKIPPVISRHRGHYKSIMNYLRKAFPDLFTGKHIDPTSINEARVCFMCYDPDIYINEKCEEYTDYFVDNETSSQVGMAGIGLTDFEKMNIAARMIDFAPDGQKHYILLKASYLMGGYIASGWVQEDDARKMLRDRISAKNPQSVEKAYITIDDGIAEGKKKPLFEIEQIEEEFRLETLDKQYTDEDRGFIFLENPYTTDKMMMDIIYNGVKKGVPLGIPELDQYFVLKENNFSVFLGHDGTGKTTFVYWMAVMASVLHNWKWIIYSAENESYRMKKQLISFILGKTTESATPNQIEIAKKIVNDHFYFIRTDKSYSIFELLNFGKILCKKDPEIKGFMIDPYNALAPDYKGQGKGLNAYEYLTRALTEMKQFTRSYCTIFVNAHSTTDSRRVGKPDEQGRIKKPYKSEIDGGAMWANKCDDFYVIHRQIHHSTEYMFTELHVEKIRDYEAGGCHTRGEYPSLEFINRCDFVGDSRRSAIFEWRKKNFWNYEQPKIEFKEEVQEDEDPEMLPF